ncbi:class I SAM-dependent methyltransferase [Jannaschia formosa]|uniref:class I SAM-dependent methyltransferase n=1 Tax=Jannaschia formosa TaxID=2259592 RepID=UPI000E1BF102|nr:class I SAM-dependent methyltransferase [Jannaschia formosa]TFL18091.1 class I SAM-dependent methyltransferase [Jannaschia formosa]
MTDAAPTPIPRVVLHPDYGPACPEARWVPAPRYLLRRSVILDVLGDLPPGRYLEMGCGPGGLLHDLTRMGFETVGVDRSASARRIGGHLLADIPGLHVLESAEDLPEASFDYLAAFEVLEHIEDDAAALADWTRYLRPGGHVLISVPAHPERWNPADVWAGHCRRYRRGDLAALIAGAGIKLDRILCYGFPLANVMELLSAPIYAVQTRRRGGARMQQEARTDESGSDRSLLTRLWPIYSSAPARRVMRGLWRIQRRHLTTERGVGFLAIGRKP